MGNSQQKSYKKTEESKPLMAKYDNTKWNPKEKYEKYKCEPLETNKSRNDHPASNTRYVKADEGYKERYLDVCQETYRTDSDTWYRKVHK